jgi:filamentous hemagglutinin family protein
MLCVKLWKLILNEISVEVSFRKIYKNDSKSIPLDRFIFCFLIETITLFYLRGQLNLCKPQHRSTGVSKIAGVVSDGCCCERWRKMVNFIKSHRILTKICFLLIVIGTCGTKENSLAQIIPDNTLGQERSKLESDISVKGSSADVIEGGATRGVNLFHSFRRFNVGEGERIYFANPQGIENIFSRVTVNFKSEILGTLGVLGHANLYLLNPKGIFFGNNVKLDIAGSFFATTAESFVFNNELKFSAINPQAAPLLTINITPKLQYGVEANKIESNGNLVAGKVLP